MTLILALYALAGFLFDAWAHGQADLVESFITPWHLIFYPGLLAVAAWVLWPIWWLIKHGGRGGTPAEIPAGYLAGAFGALMSMFAAVIDVVWHWVSGVEHGINALISPPHLLLLNGLILVAVSPHLRELSHYRVVDRSVRAIVTRVSTGLGILASGFHHVTSDVLLSHYYSVLRTLQARIETSLPNIKLRKGGIYTFYDFVSMRIEKHRPVRVLDIGAADCYLAFHLAEEMHVDSYFDCIDVQMRPRMYLSRNVTFQQKSIFSIICEEHKASYDYVIISGTLSLFNREQQHALLNHLKHCCTYFFIREVPRLTSLIDSMARWTGATIFHGIIFRKLA